MSFHGQMTETSLSSGLRRKEIHIFIDLVRRNKPEYRYLNYLADLCLSDDSAIHVTQDMIGEVLLKDEENKKLLIRTTMDATELDFDQHWDDEEDDRELVKLDWDWDNQGPSTVSPRPVIGRFLLNMFSEHCANLFAKAEKMILMHSNYYIITNISLTYFLHFVITDSILQSTA